MRISILAAYCIVSLSYFVIAKPKEDKVPSAKGLYVRCNGWGGVVVRESKHLLIVHLTFSHKNSIFGRSECEVVK